MSEKWKRIFDAFKRRKNKERIEKEKKPPKTLHKLSNFFYTFVNIIILKVKRKSGVHVKSKQTGGRHPLSQLQALACLIWGL